MAESKLLKKPLLRGYLHQEAFFVTLGACALLVAKGSSRLAIASSIIYSFGLLLLFGISSFYHRPHWEPRPRAVMKRLDHSAIFILIACTFTPICLLALSEATGQRLLLIVWATALVGILQSIFWVRAPKVLAALLYVLMGWLALPYVKELHTALGQGQVTLIFAGGVVYTVGAVFYAFKLPRLAPAVFGYHELFHFFTIVGAALHFIVIYRLIQ